MKKLKHTINFAISFLAILIQSCSSNYYMPTYQNVLKYSKKGEIDFSAGLNSVLGSNYNLGYSFSDFFSISSQFGYVPGYQTEEFNMFWPEYNSLLVSTFEATYFQKYSSNKKIYPELTVGYSSGKSNDIAPNTFKQYYTQPSISFRQKWLGLSLSNKLSNASFKYEKGANPTFFLFEPAITMSLFHKYSKFQIQYVVTTNRRKVNEYLNYNTFNEVVTLGFSFNQNFVKNLIPNKPKGKK